MRRSAPPPCSPTAGPTETGRALATLLIELAREAGVDAAARRRGDEQARRSRPMPALELDAAAATRRRHLLRARRRRHDPDRAARLRGHRRAGVRRQLRRDRLPGDGRPRGGATTGSRRALAGDFEVLSLPGIELSTATGTDGWRSTTSRSTASRATASPISSTRSARDEVGRVRCDGLVVATPAGSTGYNLANGGPVMAWGVEGFVVSFIAPHSLTARALVVAPGDRLAVHNRSREEPVDVTVDGRPMCALEPGEQDRGAVRRPTRATLAQMPGTTFYQPPAPEVRAAGDAAAPERGAAIPSGRGVVDHASMLHELRVENLLLMERAELRLAPGLNVLTGETGAGKTLLAHALDLLLGGRARRGIVRPGAAEAYVEGVFELPAGAGAAPSGSADRRRGARAGPAGVARRAHARLRLRARRHAGRPAGARRPAAVVLRPARAPQADAVRRLSSSCSTPTAARRSGGCAPSCAAALRAGARARGRASPSCASWPAPATASSTCSRSSCREIEAAGARARTSRRR